MDFARNGKREVVKEVNRILEECNREFHLSVNGVEILTEDSTSISTGGLGSSIEDYVLIKLKKPFIKPVGSANKAPYDFRHNTKPIFVNIKTAKTKLTKTGKVVKLYSGIAAGTLVKKLYSENKKGMLFLILVLVYKIDDKKKCAVVTDVECYSFDAIIYHQLKTNGYILTDNRGWGELKNILSGRLQMPKKLLGECLLSPKNVSIPYLKIYKIVMKLENHLRTSKRVKKI